MIVLAHVLEGPGTPREPGGGFRFVGRAAESERLLTAVRRPPAVVFVEGEAGAGKSRLVHEAAADLRGDGILVLTGFCHPLREPLPYGPVVDALEKAIPSLPADGLPPLAPPLVRLLPGLADRATLPPGDPADPLAERGPLLQAVRSFLDALGPAVLIVEDAHWIDDATRDLLLQLARTLPERLCLVLTYRAEDLPSDTPVLGAAHRRQPGTASEMVRLGRLDEDSVAALAEAALGDRATPALVEALYRRSEGLPLVVEEDLITLADHPVDREGPDDTARLRAADVPRGLREAFTERLATLSPAAEQVVAAAAALAVPSAEAVLGAVGDLDEEQAYTGLVEALRASLLREAADDRYGFRHVLAQQVAYTRLPGPLRRRLHTRAVRVLEAQTPPPLVQLAHHAEALGDRPVWLRRTEEAADQAVLVGDVGTAAVLLRRILRQPDSDVGMRSRAALHLAPIAGQGADFDENAAALRAILDDDRLPTATRGEIRTGLGLLLTNQSFDEEGYAELSRALTEIGAPSLAAVPALVALAVDESVDAGRAERWMAQAEEAVRDVPDGALAADVRATRLTLRAMACDPGVWNALEELPRRGVELGVLRQTARAVYNVAENAIDAGHDRRSRALMEEALELGRSTGFPAVELYARMSLYRLDALAGRWDGLDERFAALHAEYPDTPVVGAERALFLGTRDLARGSPGRALEHFARASAVTSSRLTGSVGARAVTGSAEGLLAQGDASGAWTGAHEAIVALHGARSRSRAAGLLPVAVAAALACGERHAAEHLVVQEEHAARGLVAPAVTADLHTARGLLAEETDAERAAAEHHDAHLLWRDIGRLRPAARSAELRARALRRTRPEEASSALAAALGAYAALDATADLARARRLGHELGTHRPSSPGRRGYGKELSPREREVAELLAHRATNQDIAAALVLSPRTVEHHVANVLKKLGTTRKAVATALANRPAGD
ncbi:ATP-binding protein [Streptomyces sp. NPDC007818]|uniref:ATP-binding protein n=1 Tax=Streptomyces sp. NPDC007818 TaxID=3364780 RepID=UPI0036926C9B